MQVNPIIRKKQNCGNLALLSFAESIKFQRKDYYKKEMLLRTFLTIFQWGYLGVEKQQIAAYERHTVSELIKCFMNLTNNSTEMKCMFFFFQPHELMMQVALVWL